MTYNKFYQIMKNEKVSMVFPDGTEISIEEWKKNIDAFGSGDQVMSDCFMTLHFKGGENEKNNS